MQAFDAIIGHTDRHPYNWGVIVPTRKSGTPRFSPIYDTARALFWNKPESKVVEMLGNTGAFEAYIAKCKTPIGWEGREKVDFFQLINLIWNAKPEVREAIEPLLDDNSLNECIKMMNEEFSEIITGERRELIERCLRLRQKRVKDAIS